MRTLLAKADPARLWTDKMSIVAAWIALLLAVFNPPHGTGITVCSFKACTGMPCIGCGLTRSMSCALRGMFGESWSYHPFGIPLLIIFILIATFSLAPCRSRDAIRSWLRQHEVAAKTSFLCFFASFVAFGIVRWLLEFSRMTW